MATVAPSMMTDRDMNLKDNYFKRRKSPGSDINRPGSMSSGYFRPNNKLTVNLPPDGMEDGGHSELSMEDDCQRYHWDCSDWAGQAMMEIPAPTQQQVIDPNNWSHEAAKLLPSNDQPVDPTRDIETLPEDEDNDTEMKDDARSVASSGCESQLGAVYPDTDTVASPMHQTNKSIEELLMSNDMNYADDDNGSVDIPNIYDYKLHLNNYLPTYHLGSDPDTDEATPMLGRHPKPFPTMMTSSPEVPRYATVGQLQQGLVQDPEASARKSGGPLRGLILPPALVTNGQSTDKLCEIEDEDEEDANGEIAAIQRTPSPRVTRV